MMNEIERHNRQVMIERVQTNWLDGVLQKSLHGGPAIHLRPLRRPTSSAARSTGSPTLTTSTSSFAMHLAGRRGSPSVRIDQDWPYMD